MNSLVKYNQAQNSIEKVFEGMFQSLWDDPYFLTTRNWRPTDVRETDEAVIVEVELPRFKKNEVKVETKEGCVVITAKNNKSSYSRSLSFGGTEAEKTKAVLEDGVLTVTIPKIPEAQPKLIEIQ